MKILNICLCGGYMPGWGYQDNMIAKYQSLAGHDVSIITSNWVYNNKGEYVLAEDVNTSYDGNIKIIRLPIKGEKHISAKLKRFIGLYQAIEQVNPDVIFLHCPQLLDAETIVSYLKKHHGVKLFVDNHNDFKNGATNFISKYILHGVIWRRSVKMLDKYAIKFYGVTPARVKFLKQMYGLSNDRVELLVMGADDEKIQQVKVNNVRKHIREKYNILDTDLLLLTGGKIDANKPETLRLMEAVINLRKPEVKLMIFGSVVDSLREEFDKLYKHKNIIYVGWIQSEEIYNFFEASDLILFSGLHSVLWEQAVGAGKPVVFRKIEGFEHIDLGGNCCFFDELTVDGITKTLENILSSGQIENMKKVAEVKGMQYFSYKDIAQRCIKI